MFEFTHLIVFYIDTNQNLIYQTLKNNNDNF